MFLKFNIENYISEIKDKVFVQNIPNAKYIGIHYRGTDKISEKNTPEEFPIHYEYDKIYDRINKKFDDYTKNNNDIRNGVQDIISNIFNEKKDKTVELMNKIIENETNDNLLKNGF